MGGQAQCCRILLLQLFSHVYLQPFCTMAALLALCAAAAFTDNYYTSIYITNLQYICMCQLSAITTGSRLHL